MNKKWYSGNSFPVFLRSVEWYLTAIGSLEIHGVFICPQPTKRGRRFKNQLVDWNSEPSFKSEPPSQNFNKKLGTKSVRWQNSNQGSQKLCKSSRTFGANKV